LTRRALVHGVLGELSAPFQFCPQHRHVELCWSTLAESICALLAGSLAITLLSPATFAWQQTASSWGSRAGFTVAKLAGNVPGLSGIFYFESGDYLHLGMSLNYQTANPPAGLGADGGTVFNLSESRRVKRFERNYYDHPAFGVIALVTPAKPSTGGR